MEKKKHSGDEHAGKRSLKKNRGYENSLSNIKSAAIHVWRIRKKTNIGKLRSALKDIQLLLGIATSAIAVTTALGFHYFSTKQSASLVADHGAFLTWEENSPEASFSVSYPNDWKIQDTKDPIDGTRLKMMPVEHGEIVENVYISVAIQSFDGLPLSLKEYEQRAKDLIAMHLSNSEIINTKESVMGGSAAISIEYKGAVGSESMRFLQSAAFEKDSLYLVTYSAPSKDFKKFKEAAQSVMHSLDIEG